LLLGSIIPLFQAVEKIFELFPKTKELNAVEVVHVGTPLTHNHYFGGRDGEAFGLDYSIKRHDPEFLESLVPTTSIKGLFMTGQGILTHKLLLLIIIIF
jgi:phytoene dehydrogenase-like protein